MTSVAAAGNTAPAPSQPPLSPMDQELVLLETLKSLLESAMRSLAEGRPCRFWKLAGISVRRRSS